MIPVRDLFQRTQVPVVTSQFLLKGHKIRNFETLKGHIFGTDRADINNR